MYGRVKNTMNVAFPSQKNGMLIQLGASTVSAMACSIVSLPFGTQLQYGIANNSRYHQDKNTSRKS